MTLVWKEWRQIRVLLLLPVLILLVPVVAGSRGGAYSMPNVTLIAGVVATFLTCYAAGVSSYGMEFSGHTTAYLATRPIAPAKVFAIKIAFGLLLCFAAALVSRLQMAEGGAERAAKIGAFFAIWVKRWWLIAPTAYLAVLLMTLLIREQLLALILALVATWLAVVMAGTGVVVPSLLSLMMVAACYVLALRRREIRW